MNMKRLGRFLLRTRRGRLTLGLLVSAPGNRNPDAIEVFTFNAAGASQYRSFSAAVYC